MGWVDLNQTRVSLKSICDNFAHCARLANILVYDTQYLEHEILGLYHMGHSTIEDALEIARMAEADQLMLFHHAPEHSDTVIDEKLALARDLSRDDSFAVDAAREGWSLDLENVQEVRTVSEIEL